MGSWRWAKLCGPGCDVLMPIGAWPFRPFGSRWPKGTGPIGQEPGPCSKESFVTVHAPPSCPKDRAATSHGAPSTSPRLPTRDRAARTTFQFERRTRVWYLRQRNPGGRTGGPPTCSDAGRRAARTGKPSPNFKHEGHFGSERGQELRDLAWRGGDAARGCE